MKAQFQHIYSSYYFVFFGIVFLISTNNLVAQEMLTNTNKSIQETNPKTLNKAEFKDKERPAEQNLETIKSIDEAAPLKELTSSKDENLRVEDDFFAMLHAQISARYRLNRALISREHTQVSKGESKARNQWVSELSYVKNTMILEPQLGVNLWQILELYVEWPLMLWSEEQLNFSQGTTVENSSIAEDMKNRPYVKQWPEEGKDVGSPAKNYNDWAFDLNRNGQYSRKRAGFLFPKFGFGLMILNQKKAQIYPTMHLNFEYQMGSVGFLALPVALAKGDSSEIGAAAKTAHRFKSELYISKQILQLTPYFRLDYILPLATENAPLGYEPRHQGGVEVGFSWLSYEDKKLEQRFGLDFNFKGRYFSPGREYTELSNVFDELTFSDEYMRYAVGSGFFFQAWDILLLNLNLNMFYDTSHLLTGEVIGCDGGCPAPGLLNRLEALQDNQRTKDGQVTLNQSFNERNPYFNPITDAVGRRFKVEESFSFELMFKASVTF